MSSLGPPAPPEGSTDLQHAIAVYHVLMNRVVVPESQYAATGMEDVEKALYLGGIMERAAARRREAERERTT